MPGGRAGGVGGRGGGTGAVFRGGGRKGGLLRGGARGRFDRWQWRVWAPAGAFAQRTHVRAPPTPPPAAPTRSKPAPARAPPQTHPREGPKPQNKSKQPPLPTPPGAPPRPPQEWIEEQKEFAGLERSKRNVWVQIQLDGTVRASDVGSPPWARLLADLPPLDSFKTKVTDGIGPSV